MNGTCRLSVLAGITLMMAAPGLWAQGPKEPPHPLTKLPPHQLQMLLSIWTQQDFMSSQMHFGASCGVSRHSMLNPTYRAYLESLPKSATTNQNGYRTYSSYQAFRSPGSGYCISTTAIRYADPAASYLVGSADVMRSYGAVITSQENARLLNEASLQAGIDTRKKMFDLRTYIAANTPTYTQKAEQESTMILRRMQTNAKPGEIANGAALNTVLDALRKQVGPPRAGAPVSEEVLASLNVTTSNHGIGRLRNGGKVGWPAALLQLTGAPKRDKVDADLQALVAGARKSQVDAKLLGEIRNDLNKTRDVLVNAVNDVPTGQYLDAKRFLNELVSSLVAVERGETVTQQRYQNFIEGGRSVHEVVEYLVRNGLRFGPATSNDEAAYRAFHSLLAEYLADTGPAAMASRAP
jgi:hypothetical protein